MNQRCKVSGELVRFADTPYDSRKARIPADWAFLIQMRRDGTILRRIRITISGYLCRPNTSSF